VFHPLSLYVGLRYVRARTHKFFVSFITWVSLIGVCTGVAALIVILSVMNGFEDELRGRLLSLTADARVVATSPRSQFSAEQWDEAARRIAKVPGVAGIAPYITAQVLAVSGSEMLPVTLRGIDPRRAGSVIRLAKTLKRGSLAELKSGTDRTIVSDVVAEELGIGVGNTLTLLIPTIAPDGTPTPKLRELTVAGLFQAGLEESQDTVMFANRDDVRALGVAASGEGLHVRFDDPLAAPRLAARIEPMLAPGLTIIDWTHDYAGYFRAIRIEKTMMSLILLLIVAVAAFNVVAMLVMVVNDKRTDIAILRTLGAGPRRIMGVFLTQGLAIGWIGVALGIAVGVTLALNVETIVPFLQRTFDFHFMDPNVYYDTSIPSDLHWSNVAWICVAALALTALATLYPALRASRTSPADALRYE
jgi:lipoprotein-releasing system permease protein